MAICMYVCMYVCTGITSSKSVDQRKMNSSLSAFAPENLVSRDESRPASACSSISILRLNLVLTYGIPPEFRDGVHLYL